jgi:hypothetical protein
MTRFRPVEALDRDAPRGCFAPRRGQSRSDFDPAALPLVHEDLGNDGRFSGRKQPPSSAYRATRAKSSSRRRRHQRLQFLLSQVQRVAVCEPVPWWLPIKLRFVGDRAAPLLDGELRDGTVWS